MSKVIEVKNVSKRYKLYRNTKERLLSIFNRDKYGEEFYALDNVNFSAEEGDVVGFIGTNGSGKSTLSNIISGIVPETSGEVHTRGNVMLIAVAAGLNNDLTGRENIELKCLMLGFSKQEIKELEPEIIEFSELGTFIDQPVKSYSSGMKSRLGFAISVSVNPDILIIDEALSVGDKAFAEKSLAKMKEFKEQGKTMIFVSHSISQMKQFCDKILWLEFGKVKAYGEKDEVLRLYESFLNKWSNMKKSERDEYREQLSKTRATYEVQLENEALTVYKTGKIDISHTSELEIKPVSRIAHIKAGNSKIYESPGNVQSSFSSASYKNKSYFITRTANYNYEDFYLLSDEKSSTEKVIGWMKASEIQHRGYAEVESTNKIFILNGKGNGYSRPWGGKKQLFPGSMKKYKNQEFKVKKIVMIAKTPWYFGEIDGIEFWVHNNIIINTEGD
ncbi:teichoic acids export ABC transporter ATP-binding subunit TagH [Phocicoccus pinnipedialis]|uniref:Teichoic acids export ATP-binding protein TagH n=1 Tax=Phocicoccus pinnipedialis TaxID=110845 RepID=A0A6V7R6W9_9BACL|nr:teichoic acids export ABC transporter ATP-binding subunit TagH [Jeotgalicoccus pinnipedialis]MBP1938964.1 teichoic acid transport system ATP-binding protein [Jeotgalicoccus pinnipedialis]CAD2073197.1 Teichoic acids export ATP-binding protein TagH [Jeotgalicoccus pinnipedialis]